MGIRGPIPERDSDRRRRNKPEVETTKVEMAEAVEAPEVDPSWHKLAKEWYLSLKDSGQSKFLEPSDWAAARILANDLTRHLNNKRPSSQYLAALWSAMNDLLTTEGARRRVRMEIERPDPEELDDESGEGAAVIRLDHYRSL